MDSTCILGYDSRERYRGTGFFGCANPGDLIPTPAKLTLRQLSTRLPDCDHVEIRER